MATPRHSTFNKTMQDFPMFGIEAQGGAQNQKNVASDANVENGVGFLSKGAQVALLNAPPSGGVPES